MLLVSVQLQCNFLLYLKGSLPAHQPDQVVGTELLTLAAGNFSYAGFAARGLEAVHGARLTGDTAVALLKELVH